MPEYELLREEIMENCKDVNNSYSILYTAIATILTFALKSDDYLLCLIPYFIIVPMFFLCESKHNKICWIGAYLYVFLEGKDYNWENRHHKYDRVFSIDSKRDWHDSSMYYIVSCACSGLSIYKLVASSVFAGKALFTRISIIAIFTMIIVIIMKISMVQYVKNRSAYINKWEQVKKWEQQEHIHTDNP